MIVLDEQLADPQIIASIEGWYKGKVTRIQDERPLTKIPDDVIPALLRRLKAPTFVTINYDEFWRRILADSAYCVICLKLTSKRCSEISDILRTILSRPEWSTKRKRMGNVTLVSDQRIAHYSSKRQIRLVPR